MRIAIGGLTHETHTFLPEKTEIDAFERGAARGAEILDEYRDTNTVLSGFIDGCESADAEIEPIAFSKGGVSGTVREAVYDRYVGELHDGIEEVADEIDGVLLFLHGAMVTEEREDPELDIVREIREVVGQTPIVVGMDLHGNVSPELADVATAVSAYRSSPHVDGRETGRRAADLLVRTVEGEIEPTTAIAEPGLVVPSPFSATTTSPAREIVSRAIAWEVAPELYDVTRWEDRDEILDTSVFFGFAWSDVRQLGAATVAVTDDDPELAEEIVADVSEFLWSHREELTDPEELYGVEEGIAYAIERAESATDPILLLDAADRLAETTYVLRELLEQDAENVAFPLLHDPEAVERCADAGEGSELTLAVGSKSSPRGGEPVELTGTVEWIGERTYTATGPMRKGQEITHGPTAIVRADGIWLQLTTEMDTGLIDTDPIEQYGADPHAFDLIVSKSKTHFRAVFEELAEEIVIVDAPEYSPADLDVFEYENVADGIYPITSD